LGVINNICKDNGFPYISVIVHNKQQKTKVPSIGFFSEFFPEFDFSNISIQKQIYEQELKKAKDFKEWDKLIKILSFYK
jgi:hypothetical protein